MDNPCATCGHDQTVHYGSFADHCIQPLTLDGPPLPGEPLDCQCEHFVPHTEGVTDPPPEDPPAADPPARSGKRKRW
jgi:hypothetical protein